MGPERVLTLAAKQRPAIALSALVTTFAGVALLLDRPKENAVEWVGIPLLILGGTVLSLIVLPLPYLPTLPEPSLASRFLQWVTLRGRLSKLFPVCGIGVLLTDLAYNMSLSGTPAIQTEDSIVLLTAATLISYGFVPHRFARERDFVLIFFVFLNLILVVPLLIARVYYNDFEHSVDLYSWVALAPQTSAVLSLIGVANSVHSVSGSSAPGLTFVPKNLSLQVTVV